VYLAHNATCVCAIRRAACVWCICLRADPLAEHARKKTCKDNPNCVFGVGESGGVGIWGDKPSLLANMPPDPEQRRRHPDAAPAGLINLGATCYMNVLLQCLFWNERFRQALFQWAPGKPSTTAPTASQAAAGHGGVASDGAAADVAPPAAVDGDAVLGDDGEGEGEVRVCAAGAARDRAVAALQTVFAELLLGVRRYASTLPFVDALGVPRGVQQDAEEFNKVLLSLLHDRFQAASDAMAVHHRNVIPETFAGDMTYETTCLAAKAHCYRSRPEQFFELVRASCASLVCG
jgi:hypothetical protein